MCLYFRCIVLNKYFAIVTSLGKRRKERPQAQNLHCSVVRCSGKSKTELRKGRIAKPQAQNLLVKRSFAWGFASLPRQFQFQFEEFEAELYGRLRDMERPQCTSSASYGRLIRAYAQRTKHVALRYRQSSWPSPTWWKGGC